jgi:NAD(P)-dependent dehydrogenase (short-subunit alcohol dehydrogenase family)
MPEKLPGSGKTVFITGGSRGIGHAIAVELAHAGYDVAFTYATCEEAAAATKEEIEGLGRRCFYYQATLQDRDAPKAVTNRAIADLGRLDVLVTVAGITKLYQLPDLTVEEIDDVYSCNFRAPLLCAAAAAKHMIEAKIPGNIIHIASTHGYRAYPKDQVYGGLKAGIIRATESEALELSQYGIRVNCIAPGMISVRGEDHSGEWFKKIPLGRSGKPQEIANVAAFLVSDKASYITGETIKADGGLILPGMPEDKSPEAGYGWSKR